MTASTDLTARVWNSDGTGEPVVLAGHGELVWSASFSPDDTRVVTASGDKTARVWKVVGELLQAAIADATTVCLGPEFRRKSLGESPEQSRSTYPECERDHGRCPTP